MKVVALTGGGTAGHVMPHFALLPEFTKRGWNFYYIGSAGIEKQIVKDAGLEYFEISAGKLRRYFSWQNFLDVLRVILGLFQSIWILLRRRPDVIFSKGGFVSVPVCIAGRILGIPVITHESDLTPGLATKIISKFANHIFYTFEETRPLLPPKAVYIGAIVRPELLHGDKDKGLQYLGFVANDPRPIILVMGGSLGAQKINQCFNDILPNLIPHFRVVHITGKGKGIPFTGSGYVSFEYVGSELKDVLAAVDLVVARAGANSIFEFLSLRKPMLLIPLESGSRGDQVHNAESFAKHGWANVLKEGDLNPENLMSSIEELKLVADRMQQDQAGYSPVEGVDKVIALMEASLKSK